MEKIMFTRRAPFNAIQGSNAEEKRPLLSCFTVGSTVRCTICFDEEILGEVVAFDAGTKMLLIKVPNKRGLSDINIVNLNFCLDVEIVKEVELSHSIITPAPPDLPKLEKRLHNSIEQRAKHLLNFKPKVSPMGQALFRQIAFYLGDSQVYWLEKENIISILVMEQVIIEPPYGVANVNGPQEATKLKHYVQWIVQKFLNKQH
ncbi:protein Hezron [Drosophila guanche]|uniref:Blast:Protein LSM12 homolog B n=1 Tax=Drosophila guanche TaxID=7266 RepID=A0A3B0J515_DROGU|nr:protein Hezron [Drosophila guanche]SPP76984.1 blast:Protein LSM12 homolog B [Drosophila guanche]